MGETRDIRSMPLDELVELHTVYIGDLQQYEEGSSSYNFLKNQLELIEAEIDKRAEKKAEREPREPDPIIDIVPEGYMRLSQKAKELKVCVRSLKNWIYADKIKGIIRKGPYRYEWFVPVGAQVPERTRHERPRDSRGRYVKRRRS